MPKGRCNWKLSVWGVGRGGPGQSSSEPAAQACSDAPALSFCSFISAQKGDRTQLHGNLLDKETLPRAASTELCLAKQLLQVKMCQSRAGSWSRKGAGAGQLHRYSQGAETRAHGSMVGSRVLRDRSTTARSQGILTRPFCALFHLGTMGTSRLVQCNPQPSTFSPQEVGRAEH